MRRGEIRLVNFNPNKGAEVGKLRPAVILTDSRILAGGLPLVTVLPLSSQYWPALEGLRVTLVPRERLLKPSYVMLEQIRSVDRARIGEEVLSQLTQSESAEIEKRLGYLLGFI